MRFYRIRFLNWKYGRPTLAPKFQQSHRQLSHIAQLPTQRENTIVISTHNTWVKYDKIRTVRTSQVRTKGLKEIHYKRSYCDKVLGDKIWYISLSLGVRTGMFTQGWPAKNCINIKWTPNKDRRASSFIPPISQDWEKQLSVFPITTSSTTTSQGRFVVAVVGGIGV